jgi:hypothetical protein
MKGLVVVAALLVALVGLLLMTSPSVKIRYRLAVETEWKGQLRAGSGVIQVSYGRNTPFFGSNGGITIEVEGEAVSIDVGPDDTLFVLLKAGPLNARSGPEYIIPNLFEVAKGGFGPEEFPKISAIEGQRDVPLELLPLMVRIPNTKDPNSAVLFVPPGGQLPNQDLILKRVMIEIVSSGIWPLNQFGLTGVSITHSVQQKLPWLPGFLTGDDFMKGAGR